MVNKNYLSGRRFEYKVKHLYEQKGWVVLRTAGSHGFADLVCLKKQNDQLRILFLQLKTFDMSLRKENEISDFWQQTFAWLDWVDFYVLTPKILKEEGLPDAEV